MTSTLWLIVLAGALSIVYGIAGTLQIDELAVELREVGTSHIGLIFALVTAGTFGWLWPR